MPRYAASICRAKRAPSISTDSSNRWRKVVRRLASRGRSRASPDGDLHVFFARVTDEFRQAEVTEEAESTARDGKFSDEAHQRDAHPKRIEARRVAIIGEGVECDVETVIQFEVSVSWAWNDEFHPVRLNPAAFEKIQHPPAMAAFGAQNQQSRFRNFAKYFCPEIQLGFVDFAKAVQASKGHEAVFRGRQFGSRRAAIPRGVVAPEAVEEIDLLGSSKFGVRSSEFGLTFPPDLPSPISHLRFQPSIANPVANRFDSGARGVARKSSPGSGAGW